VTPPRWSAVGAISLAAADGDGDGDGDGDEAELNRRFRDQREVR
jgi:hypothetical protein